MESSNSSMEEIKEDIDLSNNWGIKYEKEKNLRSDLIIEKYCHRPNACPIYFQEKFILKESNKEDILNPYYLRYNNTPFRKRKLLLVYDYFNLHKTIPARIILNIIYIFIVVRLNATQIYEKLSNTSKHKKLILLYMQFIIILCIVWLHI